MHELHKDTAHEQESAYSDLSADTSGCQIKYFPTARLSLIPLPVNILPFFNQVLLARC